MKKEIKINQEELEKWWHTLNKWELPRGLREPNTGDEKQFIRGAFAVVDSIITWKYPKFMKKKSRLTPQKYEKRINKT